MSSGPRRNDPCPCGSGRKYKHCCQARDDAQAHSRARADRLRNLDGEVTREVASFAADRFGEAWDAGVFEAFDSPDETLPLAVPYGAYHVPCEGRPAAEWFLDEYGTRLSQDEIACLRAERDAWLSLWVVVESRPGEGLTLRDRLSGELKVVRERLGSRALLRGATILARVVEIEGTGAINGLYPRSLDPISAAEVERRVRGYLRRKRDVPVERLRKPKVCRYLVRSFEDEIFEREYAELQLSNNDGDPILFTTDRFDMADGAEAEVAARLGALDGVEGPEPGEGDGGYLVLGDESVLVGQIYLAGRSLRVETNSRERADELRRRVEQACAGLVEHRARVHTDPLSAAAADARAEAEAEEGVEGGAEGGAEEEADAGREPPEAREFARAWKERHYAEWLDVPLPALDGQTPREAVATKAGRERVAVLVDQIEYGEQRLHPDERFDASALRRDLGLE